MIARSRSRSSLPSALSLAAGLVLLAACSAGSGQVAPFGSSGGSGSSKLGGLAKNATCPNPDVNQPRSAADQSCDACAQDQCLVEAQGVLGSDPNAYGGACGAQQQCQCDCTTGSACEMDCERNVPDTNGACKDALDIALKCLAAKCKNAGC